MKNTYLGLGSNIGDREKNIIKAANLIQNSFTIIKHSSIYLTAPVGYKEQPYFLNLVIKIDSEGTSPSELLRIVKSIEVEMGRKKTFHWGPRLIDIDILYIEGTDILTENLIIPHNEILNRNFVLTPLSELMDFILINGEKISLKDFVNNKFSHDNTINVYKSKEELPKVLNGLGIAIISTSKGLLTDKDARLANVGGEVMCTVW